MSQWAHALGAIKDLSAGRPPVAIRRDTQTPAHHPAHPLNEQQQAMVACPHPRLRVTALAGTGKTTALVEYARTRSCKNPIYLAFNRAMAHQAQDEFGARVKCKTVHSLAWGAYGRPLEHKISMAHDIPQILSGLGLAPTDLNLAFADVLMSSLDRFVKSDHALPCRQDIAAQPWASIKRLDEHGSLPGIDDAVGMVQALWARAQDPYDMVVAASHDVAIKKAQMASAPIHSDLVMVDEAQDLTPAMASWIQSHQGGILVFAGDPYQELYSWRQPRALKWGEPGEHAMALTYSHRFGPQLEPIINPVLRALGSPHEIKAIGTSTRVVIDEEIQGRHHVLGRTRAHLAEYARKAMARGLAVAWPGAQQPTATSAWSRLSSQSGRDDWLLEETTPAPTGLVHPDDADVVLSTVHQAKGQTYDRVKVLEDVFDRDNAMDRAELCVRYVALTRARREIALPARALEFTSPATPAAPADLSADGFQ